MSEKLLPCPFCGSTAETSGGGTHVEVGCSNPKCFVSMVDIQIDRLITAWNTRATDSLPTYYILRRTVGGATGHYEYTYWDALHEQFEWSVNQGGSYLFETIASAGEAVKRFSLEAEIIPVKLLEVPHES